MVQISPIKNKELVPVGFHGDYISSSRHSKSVAGLITWFKSILYANCPVINTCSGWKFLLNECMTSYDKGHRRSVLCVFCLVLDSIIFRDTHSTRTRTHHACLSYIYIYIYVYSSINKYICDVSPRVAYRWPYAASSFKTFI